MASDAQERIRILIVEDDRANLRLLTDYLTFLAYDVLGRVDGHQLMATLETFAPHVILLDLKLPGPSGYDLITLIRNSDRYSHTPIVVLSGYAFERDRQRALALGADMYLTKPVRLQELKYCLEAAYISRRSD